MTFTDSIKTCLSKYADFSGRATRSECWWFVLFQILITILAAIIHPIAYIVVALGLFLPSCAAQVRRMHDIGKSGWYLLISIIPLIGLIVIYWLCKESDAGSNAYGPAATPASPASANQAS